MNHNENRRNLLIKESVFEEKCRELGYEDTKTIYGDFSRLVANLLDKFENNPNKLKEIYESKEYKPSANINAILKVYKKWRN